ncbi:hypothetical protein B9G55_15205 [Saccharibacillus sp. O16]|nr:hypothetical protein B9G55_15205 [Saccharibacillus sp. O16]
MSETVMLSSSSASQDQDRAEDYVVHLQLSQELYQRMVNMPSVIYTRLLRLHFKPEFLELADRALEEAELAVKANPYGVMAHVQRGRILHMLLRVEEAEQAYQTAIAYDPQDVNAHAIYAHFLMRRGELQLTRERMEIALRLDPQREDMLVLRDFIEEGERNPESLHRHWMTHMQYGVSDKQSSPEEIRRMILLLLRMGKDPTGPMKVYLKLRPDDKEIQLAYGSTLFKSKKYNEASRYFRKMLNRFPGDTDVQRWLHQLDELGTWKVKTVPMIETFLYRGVALPIYMLVMSPVLAYRWLGVLRSRDLPNTW